MAAYGIGNIANDAWIEQVVHRGWTSWSIPNVLHPELTIAWGLILLGAAVLYASVGLVGRQEPAEARCAHAGRNRLRTSRRGDGPLRALRRPGRRLSDRRTRATTSRRSSSYPGGQTTPTPERIDFTPGELLGSVSGELGLRTFLEERGHRFVVTSDKDGPDSEFERELPGADVVISQPFWPAYLTAERIAKAPNLKLAITAGIGSDHVDLPAAIERGVTVAEVTYSQQHQRVGARRDDDPRARAQLHPVVQVGRRRRLEHRRLRVALVRPGGHAGRNGRRWADRLRGAAPPEAVRGRPALHRPAPAAARRRGAARRHVPRGRGIAGARRATS